MYIKRNVIAQIQKDYGYNYKQAEDFYNKIDDECRAEFDAEYYAEARKSFYEHIINYEYLVFFNYFIFCLFIVV